MVAEIEKIKDGYTHKTNGQKIKLVKNSDGTFSWSVHIENESSKSDNTSRKMYPIQDIQFLDFVTPDGTGKCTHPSVVRFRTPWNGFKFWMAMTPYADTTQENPCIYASNDGINWVVPSGVTNPLYPAPDGTPTNYNSDTNLIYDKAQNKLIMYYREFLTTGVTIYRTESTNGVNWAAKVKCNFDDVRDQIAPTVIKTDKYYMYIGWTLGFYESTDGISWSNFKECKTNIDLTGRVWHCDVQVTGSKFRMVAAVELLGAPPAYQTELYYAESTDMINWEFDSIPLIPRDPDKRIFDERVYKSCCVYYGEELFLYISGLTSDKSERIAYTKVKLK